MKYWVHFLNGEIDQLLDVAKICEECGYEGIIDGDHWAMPVDIKSKYPYSADGSPPSGQELSFPDTAVAGAAVAAATTRLKYGSSVFILANRNNPIQVAKAVGTAAIIGGHRFILGVGGGWMKEEYDIAGVEWSIRTRRMEEMIEILRKLWGPGPVEHHGEFFDFPPVFVEPSPLKPIPIWIGGHAAPALRRAGRLADGFMGHATPEQIPGILQALNEGRAEAPDERRKAEFGIMISPILAHGEDPEAVRNAYVPDLFRRMEDLGVTDTAIGPLPWVVGKTHSTIDEKRRLLEDLANKLMR